MTRRTKKRFVSVPTYKSVDAFHLARLSGQPRFKTPGGHEGDYYTSDYGKTWHKTVWYTVALDGYSVKDVIAELTYLADRCGGVEQAQLSVNIEENLYDSGGYINSCVISST